jgi:pimeloyl-ACP methyl ester carboxylesterase
MITDQMIDFNGISIATKNCGSGKDAIIFIHGSCMNSDTWLPQLNNQELNSKYRLIAFDLPGNGQSGWFKNDTKDYRPKNITPLIKTLIGKFNIERYILVGLSYGTNIIAEINPPIANCAGILLEGVCIVNDEFPASSIITPGPNGHVIVAADPTDDELRDYTFLNVKSKEVGERFIKSYRAADPAFREELGRTMMESDMSDELENIRKWNLPVCVMFGKEEKLVKTDYLNDFERLWNKKVYHIENASHVVNEEAPEEFNKILLSFATEAFK